MNKKFKLLTAMLLMAGCSNSQIIVDENSIKNQAEYKTDWEYCSNLSQKHDLSEKTLANGALGAGVGAVATTQILGTIGVMLLPAAPIVMAGTGAGVGVGLSKSKEVQARQAILASCLNDKGYKAYAP